VAVAAVAAGQSTKVAETLAWFNRLVGDIKTLHLAPRLAVYLAMHLAVH